MKAITFRSPESLRVEEIPAPGIVDPADALVEVRLAGLCGSDLHVYHGRETGLDAGTVMGHEAVGTLVEKGRGVEGLEVGDLVHLPFTTSCGACRPCRSGLTSRCPRGALFGWVQGGAGLQGAQAERIRVPLASSTLRRVPEGVRPEEALLLGDVLSTGFFCADLSEAGPGQIAVVLGCGAVGLMAILALRRNGVERVLAVDGVPERLALAERFGAEPVDRGTQPVADLVRDATSGLGADAVLEAVGSHEAARLAFELLRPGGTLAVAGVHTEARMAFSPAEAYDRNLTFRTGRCPARRYMEELAPWVARERPPIAEVITHRARLEEGPETYALFASRSGGCIKAIFEPGPAPPV